MTVAIVALALTNLALAGALVAQARAIAAERRLLLRGSLATSATDFERSAAIAQVMADRARADAEPEPAYEGLG